MFKNDSTRDSQNITFLGVYNYDQCIIFASDTLGRIASGNWKVSTGSASRGIPRGGVSEFDLVQ